MTQIISKADIKFTAYSGRSDVGEIKSFKSASESIYLRMYNIYNFFNYVIAKSTHLTVHIYIYIYICY